MNRFSKLNSQKLEWVSIFIEFQYIYWILYFINILNFVGTLLDPPYIRSINTRVREGIRIKGHVECVFVTKW